MLEFKDFSSYVKAECFPIGFAEDAVGAREAKENREKMDYAACDPSAAALHMRGRGIPHGRILPISRASFYGTLERHFKEHLLTRAVLELAEKDPLSSARGLPIGAILCSAFVIAFLFLLLTLSAPRLGLALIVMLFCVVILAASLFRQGMILWSIFSKKTRRRAFSPPARPLSDDELPVYSVLVPLFDEADILPDTLRALQRIDYPKEKLDIKLLLEERDKKTQEALRAYNLDETFHLLVVPDHEILTKPKACNYGLLFARGQLLTIYDAEDVPDPQQLRQAAARFHEAPRTLFALQSYLCFFEKISNWLSRQFALEYLMHYRFFLPLSSSLDFPVLLGGSSCHLRVEALRAFHGWDSYNVTEDADLALRLTRHGYRIELFESFTQEEPVHRLLPWIRQRARWMKGWIQTYMVEMRQPRRKRAPMGKMGRLYLHILIPIHIVNFLGHLIILPLTIGLGLFYLESDALWLGNLALFNLAIAGSCYALGVFSALAASAHAGRLRWVESLTLPAYWLLAAFATLRALWHLFMKPHQWEKTPHGDSKKK